LENQAQLTWHGRSDVESKLKGRGRRVYREGAEVAKGRGGEALNPKY
jgi:hypothetical protein